MQVSDGKTEKDVRLIQPEELSHGANGRELAEIASHVKKQGHSHAAILVSGTTRKGGLPLDIKEKNREGEEEEETQYAETLPDSLEDRVGEIIGEIKRHSGLVVGFSGGVDSSVVAALAQHALGNEAIAVTAVSETLAEAELSKAKNVADEIGIRHRLVEFSELEDARFRANTPDRCFFCQSRRFALLSELADSLDCEILAAGTNASDPGEHRPGLEAMEEQGVYQPLLDHGIEKTEVRRIARQYGLSVWDDPAQACLSSRIPHGNEVTEAALHRIERAEDVLRGRGLQPLRVRDHDGLARIEVHSKKVLRLLSSADLSRIVAEIKDVGFERIAVDLEGYRTGSVNPIDE